MNKMLTVPILGIFMCASAGTAHATLIGDEVFATLTTTAAGGFSNNSATVGAGIEFTRSIDISIGTMVLDLDIGDDTITLNYSNSALGPCPSPTCLFNLGLETLDISGLDWVGNPSGIITDVVEVSSNWTGLSLDGFGNNSVSFSFAGAIIPGDTTWSAQYLLETNDVRAAPEPSILALMATGLIGFIGFARRKTRAQYRSCIMQLSPANVRGF